VEICNEHTHPFFIHVRCKDDDDDDDDDGDGVNKNMTIMTWAQAGGTRATSAPCITGKP
jgi:hypothetical protein